MFNPEWHHIEFVNLDKTTQYFKNKAKIDLLDYSKESILFYKHMIIIYYDLGVAYSV